MAPTKNLTKKIVGTFADLFRAAKTSKDFSEHRQYFGLNDPSVLVVQGETRLVMPP